MLTCTYECKHVYIVIVILTQITPHIMDMPVVGINTNFLIPVLSKQRIRVKYNTAYSLTKQQPKFIISVNYPYHRLLRGHPPTIYANWYRHNSLVAEQPMSRERRHQSRGSQPPLAPDPHQWPALGVDTKDLKTTCVCVWRGEGGGGYSRGTTIIIPITMQRVHV